MSGAPDDDSDKSFDATPQKLQKAREKGEIARSQDVAVAASYLGLLIAFGLAGTGIVETVGTGLTTLLDRAPELSALMLSGPASAPVTAGIAREVVIGLAPLFVIPIAVVLAAIIGQQAFLVTPSKLAPKLSRISLISNAKNKFGRSGLFEFAKSFTKLLLFGTVLGLLLTARLPMILTSLQGSPGQVSAYMAQLCVEFLFYVTLVAVALATVDWMWQHAEHQRKNMMSRKEIMDESKEAEGDPHLKQERRMRGQQIASNQMLADVPGADVVIVNPTHYAVALKWSRLPGEAPVCVAKGVDEVARAIRERAMESGVPIHSDPPAARALHGTVEIGQEIDPDHYAAVAIAIRFAEAMRIKARGRVL
jgi:flagellar biosynthetic protein FlhB